MCEKNIGRRRGVSAIVGGAIILAMFFIIIVPLVVLMQNSYALFLHESNSRRIFDTDRMSESLIVGVSQDAVTGKLTLLLSNDGPVNIRVVRVWAIDVVRQKSIPMENPCLEGELLSLAPGRNDTINVQACVNGFTGIVQFLVVTERGRIFSSNKVYLREGGLIDITFPHTLTVSIINMKKGRMYEVYVTPIGTGKVSPEKFTHKATAANENVTVAFGILPGNYSVALYENGKLVQIPEGNPQIIEVPDKTAIIFTLGHATYKSVELQPLIFAPNTVNKKKIDQITVEIYIQLPKDANESVAINRILDPLITIRGGASIFACDFYSGYVLLPGQIGPIAVCTINFNSDFTIIVNQGKILGEGVLTLATYVNAEASKSIKVVAD